MDPAREDLAVALRVSPISARGRVDTARRVRSLPIVTELVEEGLVAAFTGKLIAGELRTVSAAAAKAIVQLVAGKLRYRHRVGLRAWGWKDIADLIRLATAALPPEELTESRGRAKAGRRVTVSDDGDGVATIHATICDVDAHRISLRLTAIATGLDGDDDDRSIDQQRADVFTGLLLAPVAPAPEPVDPWTSSGTGEGATGSGTGPSLREPQGDARTSGTEAVGTDVVVDVVITLATLLGLAEDPARVAGLGPIPADVARELAADEAGGGGSPTPSRGW